MNGDVSLRRRMANIVEDEGSTRILDDAAKVSEAPIRESRGAEWQTSSRRTRRDDELSTTQ